MPLKLHDIYSMSHHFDHIRVRIQALGVGGHLQKKYDSTISVSRFVTEDDFDTGRRA